MWKGGINTPGMLKILTQQFARGARSVVRRVEITFHDERLFRTTVAKCATENETLRCSHFALGSAIAETVWTCALRLSQTTATRKLRARSIATFLRLQKKPGGKLDSPPGLKLGVVIPKAFGVVIKRRALMPLFLR